MLIHTDQFIGESAEFCNVFNSVKIIAATNASVLILGESGTGKEHIAKALHQYSQRNAEKFHCINCAALPENLVESELFGHKKGAFTGADSHKPGRIDAANGGTLFLDEIGELPMSIQAKFLRFLESGEYQALGSAEKVTANVRIVAATNRDLLRLVDEGKFRQDLYYRLNVIPIKLPSLRERGNDCLLLLDYYSRFFASHHQLAEIQFSSEARKQLKQYHWPGNVRELKNFVERMAILCAGTLIDSQNLPAEMRKQPTNHSKDIQLPDEGLCLEDVEIDLIQQALEKSKGNRSGAARLLGLTRDTLLYRIRKYAI